MSEDPKTTYHIYGRTDYAAPLELVTTVEAAGTDDLEIPSGVEWVELIAFPESAVIPVIPRDEGETI